MSDAKAAAPAAAAARPKKKAKVRATRVGYYDHVRRRVGDVFVLNDEAKEFSATWMEKVDARTPERVTTGAEELQRIHDETLAERAASRATGDSNVI